MIRVDNLTKSYRDVTAVNGASFEVPKASICGFIGPNGAGKTTTMRILATLEVPTTGSASIHGHDVVDDPNAVRSHLGFMPDYYGTYAAMSVSEYLDFFARAYRLRGEMRLKRIENVVAFTEVESLLLRPVDALSKGQKQRLSLARALLPEPNLLILDEPAAGLDPRARVELRELLKILAERGTTIFISSHILSELADLIDQVVIIDNGAIRYSGPLSEVDQQGHATRFIVDVAGDVDVARRFLLEQPAVLAVDGTDDSLSVEIDEGVEVASELIARAVGAGLRFKQFYRRKAQLEEAYLAVTDRNGD